MARVHHEPGPDAAAILRFVSGRLDELAPRIGRVESHAAHMVGAAPRDAEHVAALQDLDLIRQVIEDLARLAGLAAGGGPVGREALGAALKLGALREEFLSPSFLEAGTGRPEAGPASGAVEFFRRD